jgi:hypothetical protein
MRALELGIRGPRTASLIAERTRVDVLQVAEPPIEPADEGTEAAAPPPLQIAAEGVFDRIFAFGWLERVADPVRALLALRPRLADGGKLLLEVQNLEEPQGRLESNLFVPWRLFTYDRVTLEAALVRAGYSIERVVDRAQLVVVAGLDATDAVLPRPFERLAAFDAGHTGMAVSKRLAGYAALEKLRQRVLAHGPSLELLDELIGLVRAPTLERHLVATLAWLVEYLVQLGSRRAAHLLLSSALSGPRGADARESLQHLAGRVAAELHG